jgi:hypothetical protein
VTTGSRSRSTGERERRGTSSSGISVIRAGSTSLILTRFEVSGKVTCSSESFVALRAAALWLRVLTVGLNSG